jgi:hypothetical protein
VDFDGLCFHADDIPNVGFPHFIVIISKTVQGKALLVPISSIKDGKYYDKACELNKNDIIDEGGRHILSKPSFVRYQWAQEVNIALITANKFDGKYQYQCKVSNDILLKIQNGAKKSKELEARFRKYFEFF